MSSEMIFTVKTVFFVRHARIFILERHDLFSCFLLEKNRDVGERCEGL